MNTFKQRLAFFNYRMLSRFAEVIPHSAIKPLSVALGALAECLNRRQRRVVARNLQRAMDREPTPADIRAAYASYVRYWLTSLRLPVVPSDRLSELVSINGIEHIHEARRLGKGVILAVPHLGNWDIAGAWLVHGGVPLTVVVEELQPPELFTWFKNFRESLGFRVMVNGPKIGSELIAALRNNDSVALLCDRDVDGSGADVEFFGEVTKLPRGPATLALRTGAVLLPVAVYEDGIRYRADVGEPVATERTGSLREDVARVTNELTGRVEELIRRAPQQWHVFQPNWPSDTE